MATTTAAPRVKIEQPVATVENTTGPMWDMRVAQHRRVTAELAAEGYYFEVGYQGICTYVNRARHRRHFTTNVALQYVECDLWGHALTA